MKDGPHGAEGRLRADNGPVREASPYPPIPFTLASCVRVEYGSKKAEARIEIDGFGSVDVDYFVPAGKPSFAIGKSIKSRFSGAYERVVRLEQPFADALCAAIEERLAQIEAANA